MSNDNQLILAQNRHRCRKSYIFNVSLANELPSSFIYFKPSLGYYKPSLELVILFFHPFLHMLNIWNNIDTLKAFGARLISAEGKHVHIYLKLVKTFEVILGVALLRTDR